MFQVSTTFPPAELIVSCGGVGATTPLYDLFSIDYRGGLFPVGDPLNGAVRSIAISGNSEYIGGDFTSPSGNPNASYAYEPEPLPRTQ